MQLERLGLKSGRKPTKAQYKKARRVADRDAKNAFFAAGGSSKDYAKAKKRAARETVRDAFEDCVRTARRSSAEHLIATKALRCTATAWMLTAAESFAKF